MHTHKYIYKTSDKLEKVPSLFRPGCRRISFFRQKRKSLNSQCVFRRSSFLSLCGFRNLSARFLGEKRTPTNPILHRRLITWLEYSESRGNDSSRSSRVINNLSNITIRFFLLLFLFFLFFLTREDFSSKVRKFYNTDSKVTRCVCVCINTWNKTLFIPISQISLRICFGEFFFERFNLKEISKDLFFNANEISLK